MNHDSLEVIQHTCKKRSESTFGDLDRGEGSSVLPLAVLTTAVRSRKVPQVNYYQNRPSGSLACLLNEGDLSKG
jgi:hypothetical protein